MDTLHYRRHRADLIEMYRIINDQHILDTDCHCPICPEKHMFTSTLSTHTRGHSLKQQIQTATGHRTNYFSTRVTPAWNQLTEKTVKSISVNAFKNNLKTEIGHTAFDYEFAY